MRKIVALLLLSFSSSVALAANSGPKNLKGLSFCFNSDSVQILPATKVLVPDIQLEIFSKISTKLKAYRIPYFESCSTKNIELHLQVDSVKNGNGLLIFSFGIDIYESNVKPGKIAIYNLSYFGTTLAEGSQLSSEMVSDFSDLIDTFAANYAVANP